MTISEPDATDLPDPADQNDAVDDQDSPAALGDDVEEVPAETDEDSDEDLDPGFNEDEPSDHRS